MTEHALRILEFERALRWVAGFAATEAGRKAVVALRPVGDPGAVAAELDGVAEIVPLLERAGGWPLPAFADATDDLELLGVEGSVLTPEALARIGLLLEVGRVVLRSTEGLAEAPRTRACAEQVVEDERLEKAIARAVDHEGNVLDTASKELARIRERLKGRHVRVVRHLERVLEDVDPNHRVPDASVTIREGRYVIPLRREGKRTVGGYVHDESASGATVFIEPPSAIELMNEIRSLEREEVREVQKILRELSDACRSLAPALAGSLGALITLDSRRARAVAAAAWDGARPGHSENDLVVVRGRHPLLVIGEGEVIPFDLVLDPGERILLVSGPNTGGKTVFLKAVGLIAALAQSGIIPPVGPGTRLPVFRTFFADVGDEQSLAQSLSTFSAHLKNLREILEGADRHSLVLVDELGTGTDPKEGEALSRAVLDALLDSGCTAIVTSHLGGLRRLAGEEGALVNASLQFDPDRLAPTYRFTKGRPGRSYGLAIARGLRFPAEVLDRAEGYRDDTEARLDDLLQGLEAKEREVDDLRRALAEERDRVRRMSGDLEERETVLEALEKEHEDKARADARRMLLEAREEVERAIEDLRARVQAGEELDDAATEARRSVEEAARGLKEPVGRGRRRQGGLAAEAIVPGLRVRLAESGAKGTVLEREGSRAVVDVGGLRMHLAPDALEALDDQTPPEAPRRTGGTGGWVGEVNPSTEVDLRGQRVDEAEASLVRALDEAVLADLGELRVIHGKGTGALRQRVAAVLERDRRIEDFRPGGPGEGGHGVTIVNIR